MSQVQTIKRKSGKRYRIQLMKHGERVSRMFVSKREAELFLSELTVDSDLASQMTHQILTKMSLQQACDEYWSKFDLADKGTKFRLDSWCKHLGKKSLGNITKRDVKTFLRSLVLTCKPATCNRYKASLSAVFTYICDEYDVNHNPCRQVKQMNEDNERTRYLVESELCRLFDTCKQSTWERLFLLVAMAVTTGARKGELLALKWSDIDFHSRVAFVRKSKNGTQRVLPLTPVVVEELIRFRGVGDAWVFPHRQDDSTPNLYPDKLWRIALEEARISDFRFHDLRHTCASLLAAEGATLVQIAEVLGHKQIAVTMRYSHLCITHKQSLMNRVMGNIGS